MDRKPRLREAGSGHADPQTEVQLLGEDKEEKKKKEKPKMVGPIEVFRFSDCWDRLLMVIGSLGAAANGAALPVMIIVFGDMIDMFVGTGVFSSFLTDIQDFLNSVNETKANLLENRPLILQYCANITVFYGGNLSCAQLDTTDRILDKMTTFAIYYVIIGVVVTFCGYLQVMAWLTAAERQSHRIRSHFLYSILRQDIGWFDTNDIGELNTRLADDILKIHDGIGDKVGTLFQSVSSSLVGFIIGFYQGWKLTLVILSVSPLVILAATLFSKLAASMTSKELAAYAKAGAVAEEVFGAVRTVVAFGGQEKEAERYKENLGEAKAYGIRKGFTTGLSMGFIWMVIFSCYGLGFWYGGKLTRDEPESYSIGRMMVVFFCVLIGAFTLGNASPSVESLASARGAAYVIFHMIDTRSKIDNMMESGKKT